MASILTYGGFTVCDYEGDPEVVLLWGSDKANTHSDGVIGIKLLRAVERGSRVVAIAPRRTQTAARAALHLPLRPGTDCALALGMIRIAPLVLPAGITTADERKGRICGLLLVTCSV